MLRIDDKVAAKRIWDEFKAKYASLFTEMDANRKAMEAKRKAFYSDKDVSADFIEFLKNNKSFLLSIQARKIQRLWKKLRSQDTLINVNKNGNHSGEFTHLVHITKESQKVKRSINKNKLDLLEKLIKVNCWEETEEEADHSITSDPHFSALALSLFAANKIDQHQAFTALEMPNDKVVFFIVDEEGKEFTPEAIRMLIPAIQNRRKIKALSPAQLIEFKLMVAALPRSEQIFYLTEKPDSQSDLLPTLLRLDSALIYTEFLVHLSSGARDALGLACFGLKEYVRPINRLFSLSKEEIEESIRHFARYAAQFHLGTVAFENIHDYENVTALEAFLHDVYHSLVMSTIPKNILLALLRLVDISRSAMKLQWSKEIWDWIDADYKYAFDNHKYLNEDDYSNTTTLFQDLLMDGNGTSDPKVCQGGSLVRLLAPTPFGILAFIDMLENAKQWAELEINPNKFTKQFSLYYKKTAAIYEHIKNDSAAMKILKWNIYYLLENNAVFPVINDIINDNKMTIEERLKFVRLSIKSLPTAQQYLSNTITVEFDKMPLHFSRSSENKALTRLLTMDYSSRHAQYTTKEIDAYIKAIVELGYDRKKADNYAEQQSSKTKNDRTFGSRLSNSALFTTPKTPRHPHNDDDFEYSTRAQRYS